MKAKSLCALLINILLLSSCIMPRTEPKVLDCPPPEQNCFPGKWKGEPQDTSIVGAMVKEWYYEIKAVEGINSPLDEFAFSQIDDVYYAVTFTDQDRQRMMRVRKIRDDKFYIQKSYNYNSDDHVGAFHKRDDLIVHSANPALLKEQIKIDQDDYVDGEKALSNDYIGQDKLLLPSEMLLGNSGIYIGQADVNGITSSKRMPSPVNLDEFSWESQPTISPDGKIIMFASDREGGFGGTDIWYTVKINNKWTDPINAGDEINSNCDELSPFICNDGKTMLFSSSGHTTVGGYDIFQAEINPSIYELSKKKKKATPDNVIQYFSNRKNMRAPLNTEADEIFPMSPNDPDSVIYYASNQVEFFGNASMISNKGGFDIFVRHRIYPEEYKRKEYKRGKDTFDIIEVEPVLEDPNLPDDISVGEYTLKGTVYNEETKEVIPNAEIRINDKRNNRPYKVISSDSLGDYSTLLYKNMEYEIIVSAPDLFFDTYSIEVFADDDRDIVVHDFNIPSKYQLRINFPLDNHTDPYKFVLDSNGNEISRTWQEEMDELASSLKVNIEKVDSIILIGHTDYLGTKKYNIKLGQRRVDFVISMLVKRGIPKEKLFGFSAGEDKPLPLRREEEQELYRKRLRRVSLERVLKN